MTHRELIAKMTLAEKCALLSGKDVWHTRPVTRLSIPSITLSDGPSGLRKQAAEGDHLGLNASTKATNIPSAPPLPTAGAQKWQRPWALSLARTLLPRMYRCCWGQD